MCKEVNGWCRREEMGERERSRRLHEDSVSMPAQDVLNLALTVIQESEYTYRDPFSTRSGDVSLLCGFTA